jgi:hypothetical protein
MLKAIIDNTIGVNIITYNHIDGENDLDISLIPSQEAVLAS